MNKKVMELHTALLDSAVFRSTSTGTVYTIRSTSTGTDISLYEEGLLLETFKNIDSLKYYFQYYSPVSINTFNRVK